MLDRIRRAAQQLSHLSYETSRMVHGRWWRWGVVGFSDTFWTVASYRLNRAGYLLLGRGWPAVRVATAPLLYAMRPWTGTGEINYLADIDRGLRVLHPSLGVIISGKTVAGKELILVGGNCIGGRKALAHGDIRIGSNVTIGANACVMGPVDVGDDVQIGASALVVKDIPDGSTVLAPIGQLRTLR